MPISYLTNSRRNLLSLVAVHKYQNSFQLALPEEGALQSLGRGLVIDFVCHHIRLDLRDFYITFSHHDVWFHPFRRPAYLGHSRRPIELDCTANVHPGTLALRSRKNNLLCDFARSRAYVDARDPVTDRLDVAFYALSVARNAAPPFSLQMASVTSKIFLESGLVYCALRAIGVIFDLLAQQVVTTAFGVAYHIFVAIFTMFFVSDSGCRSDRDQQRASESFVQTYGPEEDSTRALDVRPVGHTSLYLTGFFNR
ncbi:hypothetical protein LshimejAT787_0603910 [Lyophyllum shimeji]|uniref:Uncharacterized protein n=1 Tax=Lyophyllum shimeji TaxID=47721 RepID=A0A9P3PPJ6_LYOSH|nr:hypothetical protein LshimejAT787_0603910 [Lyophyllum shimeji]